MAEYITIESQALTRAIAAIVSAGGSSAEEAQQVAESLVGANLTGHAMEQNMEAGVLLTGGQIPKLLLDHLQALVDTKTVSPV